MHPHHSYSSSKHRAVFPRTQSLVLFGTNADLPGTFFSGCWARGSHFFLSFVSLLFLILQLRWQAKGMGKLKLFFLEVMHFLWGRCQGDSRGRCLVTWWSLTMPLCGQLGAKLRRGPTVCCVATTVCSEYRIPSHSETWSETNQDQGQREGIYQLFRLSNDHLTIGRAGWTKMETHCFRPVRGNPFYIFSTQSGHNQKKQIPQSISSRKRGRTTCGSGFSRWREDPQWKVWTTHWEPKCVPSYALNGDPSYQKCYSKEYELK